MTIYKPDRGVRISPRITGRLLRAINALCRSNQMIAGEVIRFCFEAAVLSVAKKRSTFKYQAATAKLDAMVTIYPEKSVMRKAQQICSANRSVVTAEVLRCLLQDGVTMAREEGLWRVIQAREELF